MTRPKGLHPGVSKDLVQCPVEGCSKVEMRRDNWVKHMKTKVICGSDNKPVSQGSLQFRNASDDKKNHTLLFLNGGFSLDNLPSPIVVEKAVKETHRSQDISSMFQKLSAPVAQETQSDEDQKRKVIPHVTQLQAVDKLENFIQGSEYIIAHGAVDFQTIRALLDKTKESPSYEGVQKVDSQSFYKSVMWRDHRVARYGMQTIVEYFGDEATKAAHESGAHGALCDAEALCSVSTSTWLLDRFKDWLMFEESVEQEELMVIRPARSQSTTPTSRVMGRPG